MAEDRDRVLHQGVERERWEDREKEIFRQDVDGEDGKAERRREVFHKIGQDKWEREGICFILIFHDFNPKYLKKRTRISY